MKRCIICTSFKRCGMGLLANSFYFGEAADNNGNCLMLRHNQAAGSRLLLADYREGGQAPPSAKRTEAL